MISVAPQRFRLGDQPLEVTGRVLVASGMGDRQQPCARDPVLHLLDMFGDQVGHRVVVVRASGHAAAGASTGLGTPNYHPGFEKWGKIFAID